MREAAVCAETVSSLRGDRTGVIELAGSPAENLACHGKQPGLHQWAVEPLTDDQQENPMGRGEAWTDDVREALCRLQTPAEKVSLHCYHKQ